MQNSACSNFRGQISSNKEIIIITFIRVQYLTNVICKVIYQGFVGIVNTAFFFRKWISIKKSLLLDGRFPGFNRLKGMLSLMKSIIPPPLETLDFIKFQWHYLCCYFDNFYRFFLEKRRLTSLVGFCLSDWTYESCCDQN